MKKIYKKLTKDFLQADSIQEMYRIINITKTILNIKYNL